MGSEDGSRVGSIDIDGSIVGEDDGYKDGSIEGVTVGSKVGIDDGD